MARTPLTPAEGAPTAVEPRPQVENAPKAKGTRQDIAGQAAIACAEVTREADVASLVHDVRTPLTVIMIETQLLSNELGAEATPKARRGLQRIAQNAAYIERLVSDLLDLSAIEGNRFELRRERVDLARLIAETLERAVSSIDRPRVAVEIRDVLYADADPIRLERVIANLVGNALKFSPGSPVTIRLDTRDDHACVAVIDWGPGLSAEQAASVFDRYERTREAHAHEGYGLGLYICRRIIDAHGGRIGVTSTPGTGSQFYFELLSV